MNRFSKKITVVEKDKIRILIVVRWPGGGIRTFIRYVYSQFDPAMFKLTILAPSLKEISVMSDDLNRFEVDIIKLSERPSVYEIFIAVINQIYKNNYSIIHSQGFTSGILVSLPAYIMGVPHILTSHDVINSSQFKGIYGYIKKMGIATAFSMIPLIHSVSNDAQNNLLSAFPFLKKKKSKCVVIPNGVEVDRFIQEKAASLRSDLGLSDQTFLIGFLGRFMSQKGFTYLVEAIERLKNKQCLIKDPLVVCFGEDGFVREEKARIAEKGLTKFFLFLPFSPNVAGILKALDVVVMPSLWEACPLLAMETLVSGTPLIASTCIGLREVIHDTPARTIPPRDSKALADEIEYLMNNNSKDTFKKYVTVASERFNVVNQANRIRQLIISSVK